MKNKLLKTDYKKLRISLFLVSLLSCLFINTAYSQTSTTTVTVNGNTTTTTVTTNTPVSSTVVPNTPNFGDITTNSTVSQQTQTTVAEANKNSGNLFSGTNFCNGGWTGTQITNSPSGQTSDLGCNYLTGKGQSTYAENSLILTDKGISKIEQNLGFTQSASAYTHHFWNWETNVNMSHSVINNDTGGTITQNRVISGNRSINNGNPGIKSLDNISIGANSASGYTSKIRFDLWTPQYNGTWVGVDISQPNLNITYTGLTITVSVPVITSITTVETCQSLGTCYVPAVIELPTFLAPTTGGTTTELITEEKIKEIFKEEFIKVGLTATDIGMTNLDYKEMATQINTTAMADMKEANPSIFGPATDVGVGGKSVGTTTEPAPIISSPITSSTSTMNTTSDDKPTIKESSNVSSNSETTTKTSSETTTKTSSTTTEKTETSTAKSTPSENTKTEGSSSKTSSSENVSNEKGSTTASGSINTSNATPKDEKISVSVKAAVDKVERELKSIGDKTKAIQEIKIDGIKAGAPNLGTYENRAFYEPKYYNGVPNPDFYLQADIAQKPVYANVTLAAYTNNDPIGKQQAAMQEIQDEMNDIIIQLEQLKRK